MIKKIIIDFLFDIFLKVQSKNLTILKNDRQNKKKFFFNKKLLKTIK